jgi:threonine dehydrogenase-like Zn-dependent dehydrogenase
VIEACGPAVAHLKVGARVALLSSRSFAEYDVAAASAVVPLPALLAGQPVPGEALGCAVNIFRRCEIASGQTVAIIGIGFLGALLTQLSANAGARVIAVSRRASSLELARAMGADETVEMDDHTRIISAVSTLTQGRFCERVIEAVGKPWPLDLAGELTAERGRLIIAGYHQDGPRSINMQLWNWRGLDVVNSHERDPAVYRSGVEEALELIAAGRLDPSRLYTHRYPLERLAEALDATRDKPPGFVKALVEF